MDAFLRLFSLRPFRCCHCGSRFFWFGSALGMSTFITTLFIVSALLLGAWFTVLHALW
jgi:hypothetical protein